MSKYDESSIKSLNWREHIRLRPGMYIGKLGNGKNPDDGIYVLLKEIIDNCVDEFVMGEGKVIDIKYNQERIRAKIITTREFILGHIAMFTLGGYSIEQLIKIHKGMPYISIELIDSEQFKASDYFDVFGAYNIAKPMLLHKFYSAFRASRFRRKSRKSGASE